MKAISIKNNKIIADNIAVANNIITRFIGLLGKKILEEKAGMLITPCNSIHSFGMKFNFDAVFLDKNDEIVYLIEKMPPYKLSPIIFKAQSVLELSEGTIEKFSLKIGDKLELTN